MQGAAAAQQLKAALAQDRRGLEAARRAVQPHAGPEQQDGTLLPGCLAYVAGASEAAGAALAALRDVKGGAKHGAARAKSERKRHKTAR